MMLLITRCLINLVSLVTGVHKSFLGQLWSCQGQSAKGMFSYWNGAEREMPPYDIWMELIIRLGGSVQVCPFEPGCQYRIRWKYTLLHRFKREFSWFKCSFWAVVCFEARAAGKWLDCWSLGTVAYQTDYSKNLKGWLSWLLYRLKERRGEFWLPPVQTSLFLVSGDREKEERRRVRDACPSCRLSTFYRRTSIIAQFPAASANRSKRERERYRMFPRRGGGVGGAAALLSPLSKKRRLTFLLRQSESRTLRSPLLSWLILINLPSLLITS